MPTPYIRIRYINRAIFVLATLYYLLLSPLNHYFFGTYTWDLGVLNQVLWEYAHGQLARFPGNPSMYMLGDHFSLSLILYAPLYYIFGTYTLLWVQMTFTLAAGWGILRYIKSQAPNIYKYSPFILLFFFFHLGIVAAIRYDFHNNVAAAMMIPWLFLFYKEGKKGPFWCVLIFMVICQENIPMYCIGFLLTLMAENMLKIRATITGGGG